MGSWTGRQGTLGVMPTPTQSSTAHIPGTGTELQTSSAQLILQRGQSAVAFPELDHEVGPRRFLRHLSAKVPHRSPVDTCLLVSFPTASLYQPLRLFPVDFNAAASQAPGWPFFICMKNGQCE